MVSQNAQGMMIVVIFPFRNSAKGLLFLQNRYPDTIKKTGTPITPIQLRIRPTI
jgi:hypothetical protein